MDGQSRRGVRVLRRLSGPADPDNLKTGVDKPDLYDPKLSRAYAELAAHYSVLIDPVRARKPKDKPRVEQQMPYIRDSWWKGRGFTSLAEMKASALHWCREVAGQRKQRGPDGRTPISAPAPAWTTRR